MIRIDILIKDQSWPDHHWLELFARDAVTAAEKKVPSIEGLWSELSLVFTNDAEIRSLNAQWRGKDSATNVLSFPAFSINAGERAGPILGDIILAYETIEREAREQGKIFNHHLCHLLIHGLLHLLGYDHEDDQEAVIMEQLELDIMELLSIHDPYVLPSIDQVKI